MNYFLLQTDNEIKNAGGKARGLAYLLQKDLRVPPFFVLPFWNTRHLTMDGAPFGEYAFPQAFLDELFHLADGLNCDLFSVRSSGNVEDGKEKSFAGQFETVTNVSKENLPNAIEKVLRSAYAVKGGKNYESSENGHTMSVIIQKQILPKRSGVCFSSSPFDTEKILIEWIYGAGESLVSGLQTPEKSETSKNEALQDPILEEVRQSCLFLERANDASVDVEWCADDTGVWFLQQRPLTVFNTEKWDLPDGDWYLYVDRTFPWYVHSAQMLATDENLQKQIFGFALPVFECVLINGKEYYTAKNDELSDEVWKSLTERQFCSFARKILHNCARLEKQTKRLKKIPLSKQSDAKLLAETERFEKEYLRSYLPMMMRPDEFLSKTLSEKAPNANISALSYVDKPTLYAREQEDFFLLADLFRKEKNIEKKLTQYLDRYAFMNDANKETLLGELEKFSLIDLQKKQAERENAKRVYKQEYALAFSALSPANKRYAKILNTFTYLRTKATETSDKYFFTAKHTLFKEISKRTGIAEKDLLEYGVGELSTLLKNKKTISDLAIRKTGHFIVWKNKIPSHRFGLPPAEWMKILQKETLSDGELRGDPACHGRVVGKVKIVRDVHDANALQDGEIMVATMTVPEYTIAFKHAIGFITDEGGVSCHASIIARELNVPCVVGVKNATQTLQNGMTVDLNAYTGEITVLPDEK